MHEDHLGPVDYVVVAFSESSAVRAGFDRLLKLVDAGLIRVLDLEFVTNADGVARTVPASQAGPELSLFEGAASGLFDRDDLDAVAARLAPGATAAVLVYEELSILRVIEAWEQPVRAPRAEAIPVGTRVFHQKFGYGTIAAIDGNKLEIDFEVAGRKRVIDSFVTAG